MQDKTEAKRWVARVFRYVGTAALLGSVAALAQMAWEHGSTVALSVVLTTLAYVGALTVIAAAKADTVKCDVCGNYYQPKGGLTDDD